MQAIDVLENTDKRLLFEQSSQRFWYVIFLLAAAAPFIFWCLKRQIKLSLWWAIPLALLPVTLWWFVDPDTHRAYRVLVDKQSHSITFGEMHDDKVKSEKTWPNSEYVSAEMEFHTWPQRTIMLVHRDGRRSYPLGPDHVAGEPRQIDVVNALRQAIGQPLAIQEDFDNSSTNDVIVRQDTPKLLVAEQPAVSSGLVLAILPELIIGGFLVSSLYKKDWRGAAILAGVAVFSFGMFALPSDASTHRVTIDKQTRTILTQTVDKTGKVTSEEHIDVADVQSAEMQFNRGDGKVILVHRNGALSYPLGDRFVQNTPKQYIVLAALREMIRHGTGAHSTTDSASPHPEYQAR